MFIHKIGDSCPSGTWSDVTRLKNSDECMACPRGKMCPSLTPDTGIKSESEMEDCLGGYWCQFGVTSITIGSSGSCTATEKYDKCQPGFYCPVESSKPTPCPAGTYQVKIFI